jgi:hypothetical protein
LFKTAATVTTLGPTRTHPQGIAANWSAFMKEPADVRTTILVILAVAVIAVLVMGRSLVRSLFGSN